MIVSFRESDGMIHSINGYDRMISVGVRLIYFSGHLDGAIRSDFTLDSARVPEITSDSLSRWCERLFGRYVIVSIIDGRFEFAACDLSGLSDIYYGVVDQTVFLSDDFIELAAQIHNLEYDICEREFFITHGYCRPEKTPFQEIRRVRLGQAIELTETSGLCTSDWLENAGGISVDYSTFSAALDSVIAYEISELNHTTPVVLFSGGIDSTVILAALQKAGLDPLALTMNIKPPNISGARDVTRSCGVAKSLGVTHEFMDIDIGEAEIGQLNRISQEMPLAAHLSVNFIDACSRASERKSTVWCGQNCDTLYNLGPTESGMFIHRYLISEPYTRTLRGVSRYEEYAPVKEISDFSIKQFYRLFYGREIRLPATVNEWIHDFNNSDQYLAANFKNRSQFIESQHEMPVAKACYMLYSDKISSFFTGRDNKVVDRAAQISGTRAVMPYSSGGMVHMFKDVRRGYRDVLFPKRYLYRYARKHFDIPSTFGFPSGVSGQSIKSWEAEIVGRTKFGEDMMRYVADSALFKEDLSRVNLQQLLGMVWIAHIDCLLDRAEAHIRPT